MTDSFDQSDRYILNSPVIDEDDIAQEAELLKLQGKVPSKNLLRKRAARYEALLFDFSTEIPGAEPIQWAESPTADFDTLHALTNFALSQSTTIQTLIFDFLSDPTDKNLETVISSLKTAGTIHTDEPETPNKEISLSTALLRYISEQPRELADLYSFARSFIFSKRPEAAVRQTLRRLISQNKVKESANVYSLS